MIQSGGRPHRLQNKKALLLVTYLLLEARSHSRTMLAALLWPESNERTARSALRNTLVELRALFPNALHTDRETVRLEPTSMDADVLQLARALTSREARDLERVEQFPSAELLAGVVLDDAVDFEDWLSKQRAVQSRAFGRALGFLVEQRRRAGRFEDALHAARRRLALDPLSDVAQRDVLEVLFDAGERDAAVRAFEDYTAHLRRELGTSPAKELRELVLQRLDADAVRLPRAETPRPAEDTTLIGRDADVRTLLELVTRPEVRVLTLTGPGGVGKTRTALEVRARLSGTFDVVAFVALAPVRDPEWVLSSIAGELGVNEEKGVPIESRIGAHLKDRSSLLILDNFEQLLAAVPALSALLGAAPTTKLLVTSRSVLRLRGEHVYSLAPLEVAPPGIVSPSATESASLRLFRARARAAGRELAEAELAAANEICRRLDGLPLALELAAARLRVLPVQGLLARLQHRLSVLTSGPRDAPTRQQTLRDALAWSYDLLDVDEQRCLRALSVFVGGFELEVAERVAETPFDTLASLTDQSLITRSGEHPERHCLLETVREFAHERLVEAAESARLGHRHLESMLELVNRRTSGLQGAEQAEALKGLELEHPNFRAALGFACANAGQATVLGLELAASLIWFWHLRGHWSEGRRWYERLLAQGEAASPATRGRALYGLGLLECAQEDFELAERHLDEALPLFSAGPNPRDRAHALGVRAVAAIYQRKTEGLRPLLEESLRLFEHEADSWGIALSLLRLGILSWMSDDAERAIGYCTRSLRGFERLGNDWGVAMSLANLGESRLALGDVAGAVVAYRDSLQPLERIGSSWYLALNASGLAGALARDGRAEDAAHILGAVQTSLHSRKSALPPLDRFIFDKSLRAAREELGSSRFDQEYSRGLETTLAAALVSCAPIADPESSS